MTTTLTPKELIGPCLDKIVDGASGRKYGKLRTDAKDLAGRLESLLQPQTSPAAPAQAATAQQAAASSTGSDGHLRITLTVDEQGHVKLSLHAEPDSTDAAEQMPTATAANKSESKGMKPESAQELLDVLRVSVETRKTQLVDAALDCVQRLISHGILSGPVQSINHRREAASKAAGPKKKQADDDEEDPAAQGPMPPQAQAVELLCRCDDIPDDGIELRVLKGLLTAVTSNAVHVHGQALLLAVRTCYNIFLMSRSEVNQTTAKASLTQMLNVVFQRMEAGSEQVHVAPIVVSDVLGLPPVDTSSVSAFVQSFLHEVVTSADVFGIYTESVQQHLDDAFANKGPVDASPHFPSATPAPFTSAPLAPPQPAPPQPTPQTPKSQPPTPKTEQPKSQPPTPKSEQPPSQQPAGEQSASEDAISLAAAEPELQDPAAPASAAAPGPEHTAAELPEGPAQDAAASTAANGVPTAIVPTDNDTVVEAVTTPAAAANGPPAGNSATGQLASAADGMPSAPSNDRKLPTHQASKLSANAQMQMEAALQKDAFLVFRALCKLSVRASETAAGTDMTAIRGKVLALELLMILLENSGEVFRTSEKFSSAIKQYLCLSLLKNCTSSIPQAFALSCSIFLTLMAKFRHSLKAEIGVFFPMIMLKAIEAPQAPAGTPFGSAPPQVDMAQRFVVIRCLRAQCESGQLLVDLFVNYDCDLEGQNLFERMVLALVRLAQGNVLQDATAQAIAEEQAMRLAALQCLVNILRSLVEWYTAGMPAEQPEQRIASQSTGEENVQSWENLTSTSPSQLYGDAATEDGAEPGSPLRPTLRRDTSIMQSMMMSTGTLDMDVPAAIKDADSTREAQLLESWKAYKKGFQEGISLFNKKPKKGIAFMQEHNMLGHSPDEIAKFLAKTTGLNKTMVGEYLGEREDMCLKVMHAYVDAMNFSSLQFDEAIRTFLNGFRLPGEAQKIDRLMEKFAERFVNCNPDAFKSADVAYVLAYSVIMLNTDAHNPQVKVKMSQQDFLRNNRGINDGGDLPEEYMSSLYERIQTNEIKMKEPGADPAAIAASRTAQPGQAGGGWMDTILNLIPGRKQKITDEPNEDAIKRTHDYLREKAKGATFFEATEGETVRPMLDVSWAPMLGAFSVLFEEFPEGQVVNLCLGGFVAAIRITSLLGMGMLRNTFVTSVCRFTMLHAPQSMQLKNAHAFRALLVVADENGNHMHNVWSEVLRCVSRWELLQQLHSGGPTDALLFSPPPAESPASNPLMKLRDRLLMRSTAPSKVFAGANGRVADSFTSIHDAPLHHTGGRGKGRDAAELAAPPDAVLQEIDQQELNRMFVRSDKLDSEAIVEFVRALCAIAQEELDPTHAPRVYGLTKIVEIAHFNMSRIRLVWNRIWAVLSDFFVNVCCHQNLNIAIYAVDSLRQLAMKFLERDELANYSFQNDFMKPFVIVMRQSKAVEIRELIIRCVSQMVLARVGNVKSGWKSMFMVFTTAAGDEQPTIVRLAFETIEKIVREHFDFITETEITTFTDCVNCLIAFTNNPHSIDVSLNAIAFLRFCAMKLAEGAIGDVELELPEGTPDFNPDMNRIRPSAGEPDQDTWLSTSRRTTLEGALPTVHESVLDGRLSNGSIKLDNLPAEQLAAAQQQQQLGLQGLQFSDKDEHMYFWFPLLAGLSELTFDPRPDIRYSALEVLFDTLKFHGSAFTLPFWTRIFDSVLLPIFDHVRAEVTDISTFTDDKKRAEVDAWLYETCTQCLQHIIDITVKFYPVVQPLLGRVLELLLNFIRRTHQSLASVGVAALVRLVTSAGSQMSGAMWQEAVDMVAQAASDTVPQISDLITPPPRRQPTMHSSRADVQSPHAASPTSTSPTHFAEDRAEQTSIRPSLDNGAEQPARSAASESGSTPRSLMNGASNPTTSGQAGKAANAQRQQQPQWSLSEGAGARRLGEVRTRAAIQLLLVQACGQIFHLHGRRLAAEAIQGILDVVRQLADQARQVDKDMPLRRQLAAAQAHDKVSDNRRLADPPLMRLESEGGHAYLSMLLQLSASQTQPEQQSEVEARLVTLGLATLQRFQAQVPVVAEEQRLAAPHVHLISHKDELNLQAPLVVATLRAILGFSDAAFRRHLKEFFPILTQLISCEHAPAEVQRTLTEIFATRFGPLLQGS